MYTKGLLVLGLVKAGGGFLFTETWLCKFCMQTIKHCSTAEFLNCHLRSPTCQGLYIFLLSNRYSCAASRGRHRPRSVWDTTVGYFLVLMQICGYVCYIIVGPRDFFFFFFPCDVGWDSKARDWNPALCLTAMSAWKENLFLSQRTNKFFVLKCHTGSGCTFNQNKDDVSILMLVLVFTFVFLQLREWCVCNIEQKTANSRHSSTVCSIDGSPSWKKLLQVCVSARAQVAGEDCAFGLSRQICPNLWG